MSLMNAQKLARIFTIALSGLLTVGIAAATAAPAFGRAHGTFTNTGSMHTGRVYHTATLLKNGQVLVAGGLSLGLEDFVLSSAELYNPSTGTWTETGSMTQPREFHTATLLANGEVLVTGGCCPSDTAELYNPSTGQWRTTGSMTVARDMHSAVLLHDGEVLVAGGQTGSNTDAFLTNTAELYDPSADTFTATGSMNDARAAAPLTLLQNGEALIAGGGNLNGSGPCTAELFSNGQWSLTSDLSSCGATYDTAALLSNGDVVIDAGNGTASQSQFYDPSTNVWQPTLGQQKVNLGPLALLATGKVLVAGCKLGIGSVACSSTALYDPSTNEWTPTGRLNTVRAGHTLTRLLNGLVLATGGRHGEELSLKTAELYTP
jgi:hypothetical protein